MSQAVRRASAVGLVVASALVVATSVVWGRRFQRRMPLIKLGAAPFVGRDQDDSWDWRANWQLALPIAVALVVVVVAPPAIQRWRLRWIVLASGLAAAAFAVALAATDGADGLFFGATDRTEYYDNVQRIREWRSFIATFVERLPFYSVHIRGHPPGFVLVLKSVAGAGLHGAWPVVALSIVGVAITPIAVLVAVQRLTDATWARRAAPFLIVTPFAIWQITSADAVFTAVLAVATGFLAVAISTPSQRVAIIASAACGLTIGVSMMLTYGTVTFLFVPVAMAIAMWRRWRRLVVVGVVSIVAMLGVIIVFDRLGFWWLEGAAELRKQYWAGTAKFRTWTYFALANIAVLIVAVGPAALIGIVRSRPRWMWVLILGAAAGVTASEISQFSKGEVERIWLVFYPWLMLTAAPLASTAVRDGTRRAFALSPLRVWLIVQSTVAIVLQSALVSKW